MENRSLNSGHLRWVLLSFFAVALLSSACVPLAGSGDTGGGTPPKAASGGTAAGHADISPEQLLAMMADGDVFLVNVHIPYEGEIAGTDAFISFDEIAEHLGEMPDGDVPIVLYCRSGPMSTTAAKELAAAGYGRLYELEGGMKAWEAAGQELAWR